MQPELLLFISQPMNGFTDEEILAERERIREKVSELYPHHYINLIDSFFGDDFQKNAAKVRFILEQVSVNLPTLILHTLVKAGIMPGVVKSNMK